MKLYDWGFFFEDGYHEKMVLDYGPEGGNDDRIIHNLEDERFFRLFNTYPDLKGILEDMFFAFVIVNPPREGERTEITQL